MIMLQAMTARETILSMFTKDELKDISTYGADQGVPGFTYYSETVEFFDEHEDEIIDYFNDIFGESIIKTAVDRGHDDMRSIKNFCSWAYLESIAHEFNDDWLSPLALTLALSQGLWVKWGTHTLSIPHNSQMKILLFVFLSIMAASCASKVADTQASFDAHLEQLMAEPYYPNGGSKYWCLLSLMDLMKNGSTM